MRYGIATFPTEDALPLADLAVAAEQRGFESLWVAEHSHIPTSRKSAWPGGGELPKMYYDALDPFVALAAAAQATSSIKVATGICLVVQRDPIQTAKAVASLDVVSKGRVLFGVGAGWNEEEMANHGTDFARRFKLMRERLEAMKAIWTEDEAEYHGEFVDFGPVFAWPKPVQKPHPPIHVGGAFPGGARRAIRYGDGWLPLGGDRGDPVEQIGTFRTMAAEAGRAGEVEATFFSAPGDKDAVRRISDAGFDRVVFGVPPTGRDQVLPLLDHYANVAASIG